MPKNIRKVKECKHNYVFDKAMECLNRTSERFVYHCTKCCDVEAHTRDK